MAVNTGDQKSDDLGCASLGGHPHGALPAKTASYALTDSQFNQEHNQHYVDIHLDQCNKTKHIENLTKKRHRQKSHTESSSDNSRGKSASPGRSAKQNSKRSSQEMKLTGHQGDTVRSDSAGLGLLSSPTPSHGSGNEVGDVSFKASLLDEVLTEKKMSLLRSPEVRAFLQQQQAHTALGKISSIQKL